MVRATAFLLVLLLCVMLTGRLLTPRSNRYLTGYSAGGVLGEPEQTLDVISIGDSNAGYAVSPMEWYRDCGLTGYNYGVAWFSTFKAYYRLRTIFEQQSPQVVLLCTDMVYAKQESESYLSTAVWDTIGEILPIFRFHDDWKELSPQSMVQQTDYTWRDPLKGYWNMDDVQPYAGGDYMYDTGVEPLPVGVELFLDRIGALCRENGADLVLITAPAARGWNGRRHNGIAAYAQLRELPYLDFNTMQTLIGLDWSTDTPDGGFHMNRSGARKVSAALEEYLLLNYTFPDHRGQPGFEQWDEDLQTYLEQTGQLPEKGDAQIAQ